MQRSLFRPIMITTFSCAASRHKPFPLLLHILGHGETISEAAPGASCYDSGTGQGLWWTAVPVLWTRHLFISDYLSKEKIRVKDNNSIDFKYSCLMRRFFKKVEILSSLTLSTSCG